MGLEFNHDQGAVYVMKHLYQNGIWAIFSTLDKAVLQFKPGLLIDREMCDEILTRLDTAVGQAQAELFGRKASAPQEGPEAALTAPGGLGLIRVFVRRLPHEEKLKRLEQVARCGACRLSGCRRNAKVRMINLSENATYGSTRRTARRFAMRVHREGYHSQECDRIRACLGRGLAPGSPVITPVPLPGADGELIQTVSVEGMEPRHVVLFDWEEGAEPSEDELLGPFETLGFVTAQMHAFTRNWQPPQNFERLTWDFEGAFGPKAPLGFMARWHGARSGEDERFSRAPSI